MESILDADILIVDDNKDLLRLLREQLTSAGYRNLRTAKSCALAREAFQAKRPELMILDINLPDGDGFTLFRSLRAQADIPALFLSARDADADRLFGLGLGLLRKLAENRGHVVTYDALCASVWGEDYYGYENSLSVHIRHLREKLEPEPSHPKILLTQRGIGYRLAKEATE